MKYLVLLPAFLLFSCRGDAIPPTEDHLNYMQQVSLQSYSVPPGMQEPLKEILNRNFRSLGKDNVALARLEVLPNGQVALLAPHHIHQGMAELIKNLGSSELPAAENTVLDFWMVLGKTSEKNQFTGRLEEIKGVLEGLGPEAQDFVLLEKLRVKTALGTNSRAGGTFFKIRYGLFKSTGKNLAELNIEAEQGSHTELHTRVYLNADQYTVLGESSYYLNSEVANVLNQEEGFYTLYYVLKANGDQ